MRELGDLPGHLDACRAAADDQECQPVSLALVVVFEVGRRECGEDATADVECAAERLQLRATAAATPTLKRAASERRTPDRPPRRALDRAQGSASAGWRCRARHTRA
jgi:hypothetical protein